MTNGKAKTTWQMYRAFAGTGLACALLLALVFQLTAPVISDNKAQALNRAVLLVLENANSKQAFKLNQQGVFEAITQSQMADDVIYAGYNNEGQLVGIAIAAQGMGYQDTIELIYGYDLSKQSIIGMHILGSRETPGLGSKIGDDKAFLENFRQLRVSVINGFEIEQAVEVIKPAEPRKVWQINAISGATVSSKAVANIINQSTGHWLPAIMQQREIFERHETD